jgi:hypothetical protein
MLGQLAARGGWKDPAEYVAGQFGGVVYDFTLNFLGGHTVNHCDEPNADGPGMWIFNLALQGGGLLFFKQDEARPDESWYDAPAAAVMHREGDCIGFTDDARLLMHHAVLKDLPFKQLPTVATIMASGSQAMDMKGNCADIRVLASIRGGLVSPKAAGRWWDQFGKTYPKSAKPVHPFTNTHARTHTHVHTHTRQIHMHTPTHSLPTQGPAPAAPRRSKRTPSTPTTPVRKSKRGAASKAAKGGGDSGAGGAGGTGGVIDLSGGAGGAATPTTSTALVPADMATMPRIGDVIDTKGKYGIMQVIAVTNNFAHMASFTRAATSTSDALHLQPGMRVRMRMPPLDDTPTEMCILSIGIIHAGKRHKYYAIIFRQRRVGASAWGDLQTLNAGAFPPSSHYMVRSLSLILRSQSSALMHVPHTHTRVT